METNTETTSTKPVKAKLAASPKKAAKKVVKVAAKPVKQAAKPAKTSDGVPLKAILADLEIDGRLARRKLRAAKLDFHGHRERWTFTPSQAKQVKELLAE